LSPQIRQIKKPVGHEMKKTANADSCFMINEVALYTYIYNKPIINLINCSVYA